MDSDKAHSNVKDRRVYQLEPWIYGRKRLLRFKGVTLNIVENAIKVLDEICAEEMQGESPSPFLLEKYSLLNHYLDYLKRFCEAEV